MISHIIYSILYHHMNPDQHLTIAMIDGSNTTTTLAQITAQSGYTILYFYPKDCTSWCTVEAVEFSQMVDEFHSLNTQIIGVSKDSLESHHTFIVNSQLRVNLISDWDLSLHQLFGSWWEKSMYGRTYLWTIRNTFILDKWGRIITQYNKVTARGHAKKVYHDLQQLINQPTS